MLVPGTGLAIPSRPMYFWLVICNTYSNTVFLGKNAIKKEAQTMGAAQTDTACVALVRYNVLFLNLS